MTAYQFAKTVNALLKAADIQKVLPPQMFYTYYKKGFIPEGQRTQEGAVEWAAKYVRKHYPEVFVEEHREDLIEEPIKVQSERVTVEAITA